MASSSTNSSKQSDNQNDKSNQLIETSDESKKVFSIPPTTAEETVVISECTITTSCYRPEQQNDLSPHLIQKRSLISLTASPTIARAKRADLAFGTSDNIPGARPFEEILLPNSDTSSGSSTKPNDGNSSKTKSN